MSRRLFVSAVLFGLLFAGGCSYPDYARPAVRNYAADLRYEPPKPPEPGGAQASSEELAQALVRWQGNRRSLREDYRLGPGDVLKLAIIAAGQEKESRIDVEPAVTASGDIRCPFLGPIRVADLSTAQVEQRITKELSDGYYRAPIVTVAVSEYHSKPVRVTGAVTKPGVVVLKANRATVLEVLLEAGGISEKGGDRVTVTRATPGEGGSPPRAELRVIDLGLLFRRADYRQDILVEPGDLVNVPESGDCFYVQGFVNSPGAYPLPRGSAIGLMDAIAYAHGINDVGRARDVYLLRATPTGVQRYEIDLTRVSAAEDQDIVVQPGDQIVVGTNAGRRLLDGLLRITGMRSFAPSAY